MTVAVRERSPVEVWECSQCGNRAELYIRASGKPVCANKHNRKQMVRIWDQEAGGEPPSRGGRDGDL